MGIKSKLGKGAHPGEDPDKLPNRYNYVMIRDMFTIRLTEFLAAVVGARLGTSFHSRLAAILACKKKERCMNTGATSLRSLVGKWFGVYSPCGFRL
ncbi:hypothetical protein OKW27_004716 [Paraburkholderia sp. 35.1]